MSVTTNILQRTFHVRYDNDTATCFTIDVDGKRYLVTARHVANSIRDSEYVEISHNGCWVPVEVQVVGHGEGDLDVSVLAPQELFGASHPLITTTANLVLAEDVYFLGFPYGLSADVGTINGGFPLPLVKKAVVSALGIGNGPLFLDGHNNPGFSGGPVARRGSLAEQAVIGVVSGYQNARKAVLDVEDNEGPYTYDINTGIVVVCDIRHAIQLILDNPIGIPSGQ